MSAQRKFRRKKQPTRHYDVQMIRDFLEHLRWEYAINHFENTHAPGVVHPEFVEQLSKYQRKYDTYGLMAAAMLVPGNAPEEVVRRMGVRLRSERAKRAQEVLAALDTLQSALEEAFVCASEPHRHAAREFTIRDSFGESI